MTTRVAVLGGTAGFGLWLARFALARCREKNYPVEVVVTGRDRVRGHAAAESVGARYESDNSLAVRDADIVIVSVSIAHTASVIREIAAHVRPDAIVADVTSIKAEPAAAMESLLPESVLVIPTHPMFGPYLDSLEGQIVVLAPGRPGVREDARYLFLAGWLRELGANVVEAGPEEHDAMMSIVQGMTHYSLFVMAETLRTLAADVHRTHHFSSPIYRMLIAMIERYVGQNAELYADIQMNNPLNRGMHEAFIAAAERFADIVRRGDRDAFVATVAESKAFFGPDADQGQLYTDRIIALLGRETKRLHDRKGLETAIEHVRTGEIRTVRIAGVGENSFVTDSGETLPMREWLVAVE